MSVLSRLAVKGKPSRSWSTSSAVLARAYSFTAKTSSLLFLRRASPSASPFPGLRHAAMCHRRWATSTTPHSVAADPAEAEALSCLEQGTQKLEEGDVQGAKALYQRSVEIRRSASSLFNLGVTYYHLKEFDAAIEAWKECITLSPASADAHTNLASAYIISPVTPRPDLALHHLQIASDLSPEDPEIAFNLAAVLEACGRLEDALVHYKRSKKFGVEKAAVHIRNVSAKILGKQLEQVEKSASEEKN